MYCKTQPNYLSSLNHSSNQSNLFQVVREKKVERQSEEPEEKYEDEDDARLEHAIVKPKRVKQRLPGVKLLRRLAKPIAPLPNTS